MTDYLKKTLVLFLFTVALFPFIFLKNTATDSKFTISAAIVPHHNLVASQRKTFFAQLKAKIKEPKTIVLTAPNHYEVGNSFVQTTSQTWEITEGEIQPNTEVIKKLKQIGVNEEPTSFINEHAIKLILADIKNSFPDATIVPLIFKINTPLEKIAAVEKSLEGSCYDCLILGSVDFSHYQPALLANLHDNLTLRALENLNTNLILNKAEVDSPPSLALLNLWAKSHRTEKFVLKEHTNSGILLNNSDIETTTHFFGWYESGPKSKPISSVTFTIAGTSVLNPDLLDLSPKGEVAAVFDNLGKRVFWGTDLSLVNLDSPSKKDFFALNTIKVSSINTNSALVDLRSGKANQEIKIQGQDLTLFSLKGDGNSTDIENSITAIKKNPSNRVLVLLTWKQEGLTYNHNAEQKAVAHKFVDAGADLVVGSVKSRVQDNEIYKGKPIFYSLGSFASIDSNPGFLLSGKFTAESLVLFALPLSSSDSRPALITGPIKKALLENFYKPLQSQSSQVGELLIFPTK